MDTTRIKIADAKPGMLIPGAFGVLVLDTLSVTEDGLSFWYDTNGKRHAWARDGYAIVYVAPFRTDAIGRTAGGESHLLLSGTDVRGVCGPSRNASLDVWDAPMAVAGVTCRLCRSIHNIVGDFTR